MHRNIGIASAAILFLSVLFLTRNQVAQANQAADPSVSARGKESQSVLAAPKDCEKDKNGKVKDKCKGTVKTPPFDVVIPVTGDYSIGGFCTLSVALNDPALRLEGSLVTPLPGELPDSVQKIRQGCLLTYFRSNQRIDALPTGSSTTICFAATPNKEMTVYFYDLYALEPKWVPLETTVEAGIACAPANLSGVYVATFTKP